jgi:sec-independent protein translocase protein TatB
MKVSMAAPLEVDLGILGWADSLLLMLLALVVFGPRRLPQIGRQIGKLMYEFRKASNDFKFQMEEELRSAEEADRRKKEEERRNALAAQNPPTPPAPSVTVSSGSPYNEDTVSPPSSPAAAAESAPGETPATTESDAAPRILPPSTGEPVAAARPGSSVGIDAHAEIGSRNGHHDSSAQSAAAGHTPLAEAQAESEPTDQHG